MGKLTGKTALISGGASGIGAASARLFVEEGARVLLGDVDVDKGEALAAELGEAAEFVTLDVCEPDHWDRAVAMAGDRLGVVLNSAGISIPGNIETVDFETYQRTIAVNLDGTFLGCKAGVAAMKARGGSIVNVASMLALRAGDDFPAYCASKGGVRMLSKSVALHCARSGYPVRVNTLFPGAILTSMVEGYVAAGEAQGASREDVLSVFRAAHPMGRIGEAEEAAKAVLYLASDDSSFTTGAELTVDGGGSI